MIVRSQARPPQPLGAYVSCYTSLLKRKMDGHLQTYWIQLVHLLDHFGTWEP